MLQCTVSLFLNATRAILKKNATRAVEIIGVASGNIIHFQPYLLGNFVYYDGLFRCY